MRVAKTQCKKQRNKHVHTQIERSEANPVNPPSTYSDKMERGEAGVVRCTYINIKDIPKKPKSLQWHDFECITWCMQWANKYDTLLLAISKWIFFKWLKWTYGGCGCGPLSVECFHVVDGSMVVFDLLQRKCFGSSYTHFICAFNAHRQGRKSLVEIRTH